MSNPNNSAAADAVINPENIGVPRAPIGSSGTAAKLRSGTTNEPKSASFTTKDGFVLANNKSASDTGIPRQFQYERTQSRIGGSLWEYPMRYIENSPVFMADRVKTPVMMIHNDADDAVP